MKENKNGFVLPEKWFVETANIEEDQVLSDWCSSIINEPICASNSPIRYNETGDFCYYFRESHRKEVYSDRPQITFVQFYQYVLKKSAVIVDIGYLYNLLAKLNIK